MPCFPPSHNAPLWVLLTNHTKVCFLRTVEVSFLLNVTVELLACEGVKHNKIITWLRDLFLAIKKDSLVVNLTKLNFSKANVVYVGHDVDHWLVAPKESTKQAILYFPVPKFKEKYMYFIGLAGLYRRFVPNFS